MVTTVPQTHVDRIKSELKEAGVSQIGMHRFTITYLPKVIHPDEHIMAAVFGRRKVSEGVFGFVEGALVATDQRVLFIDHRPGYSTTDEVSYDVVSGVNVSRAGLYASVTLLTRIANYTLSFAKPSCVNRFADYIETRTIDTSSQDTLPAYQQPAVDAGMTDFLNNHEIAVLSSINRTGTVSGAVVYYTMYDNKPYFMTKSGTGNAANILGNQHVALTIFDENKLQTVQLKGVIESETDHEIKALVSERIVKPRHYDSGSHLPPVMGLEGDNFIIFRITPTELSFSDYSKR